MSEPYILAREVVKPARCHAGPARAGRGMADETGGSEHSVLCLRLMQLFPRVTRGMRRWQDRAAPQAPAPLSPRHVAALEQIRHRPLTVGELPSRRRPTPAPPHRLPPDPGPV